MKTIKIGNASVPLADYAIGAAAVLGIRDSGKTVTSKGLAEQLIESGVPVIVFDAVGKWHWLKVAGQGEKGKAFKVVVIGGRNADLPLDPSSIAEVVRSALKERISLVIDFFDKALSKADWRRIVQTSIRVIHYENEGGPVHVFLEEAAEFVPQRIEDGATYSEIEKLVRMGGNAAVGITLINQRSQEVNKAVLDQCTTLILGCQVGSKAIESVGKWMERLDPETSQKVEQSLPRLKAGQAWVWTRQNPDRPLLEQIKMCRSLHPDRRMSADDVTVSKSRTINAADFVDRLKGSIAEIVQTQKANDPELLKKQVAELTRQLAKQEVKIEHRDVPIFGDVEKKHLELLIETSAAIEELTHKVREIVTQNRCDIAKLNDIVKSKVDGFEAFKNRHQEVRKIETPKVATARPVSARSSESPRLKNGPAEVLKVVASYGTCDNETIAVMTGYKSTSRYEFIRQLKSQGLVEVSGNTVTATDAGYDEAAAIGFEPLPTGDALREFWHKRLDGGELKIFTELQGVYPSGMSKHQIAERTGYKSTSVYEFCRKLITRKLLVNSVGGLILNPKLYDL